MSTSRIISDLLNKSSETSILKINSFQIFISNLCGRKAHIDLWDAAKISNINTIQFLQSKRLRHIFNVSSSPHVSNDTIYNNLFVPTNEIKS